MTAAQIIENKVKMVDLGTVFSIEDLGLPREWWENVRVKLSRMATKGVIHKLSKGKYYKPQTSIFGDLKPDFHEIAKDLMYNEENNQIGYLTGYSIWNDMGLTTQVANIIYVGSNRRFNTKRRGIYTIKYIMQPNSITKENVALLQILDSIRFIDKIPDTTVAASVSGLKSIIKKLAHDDIIELVNLSLKYQPRIRALLGALLYDIGYEEQAAVVKNTLNPGTKYKFGLNNSDILHNKEKWNIE